jgi:predicted nucleic acid-binding protein
MIVADTNLIAYLYLPGKFSAVAEGLLLREPEWAAPRLWRSEFRNILATYLRQGLLGHDQAVVIFQQAQELLAGNEHEVSTSAVLQLAKASGCSGYDCEFVALAKQLGIKLLTADAKLRKAFPDLTCALSAPIF